VAKGAIVALLLFVAAPAVLPAQEMEQQADLIDHAQDEDAQKRRNKIQLMEGLLARAGSIAAESFGRRLQQIEPSMSVALLGQSRARGFMLEGYGVFFDVEVPELRATVVLSQLMLQRDLQIGDALAMLKRALQDMPEGPSRQQAQQAIRVLDMQAGPLPQNRGGSPSTGGRSESPAIQVSEGTAESDSAPAPASPGSAVMAAMQDPRKEYRDAVQRELTDAMLDYSVPLDIAPDEWLAVAARVSEPGQRGQTLMLRVKGSDLSIFAADKERRAEIRGRVEVSVF